MKQRSVCHPEVAKGGRGIEAFFFVLLALTACSFQNAHERIADAVTRAVIDNDLQPVMNRLEPSIAGELTRVRVAQISDELSARGTYQGLKQTSDSWCPQGLLCFDVRFEHGTYHELLKLAKDGKVRYWWIRAAPKQS
ncbi:MAG TPA: hypothetical protein VFH72_02995 [Candidatus Baltobacteraceae bacterium]|nr:hypothetical protein [Candidatus Baltobacteraceae bacterium]